VAIARHSLKPRAIYCDDNLLRLRDLEAESVDLVYLDPPFFSNKNYEVIWGDEAEVRSFEDRWEGGMQHYIEWMKQRVMQIHRVLKPTGSMYLHCDPSASHYLKVMLDGIFGAERFLNEITWKRTTAHNDPNRYGRIQDRLLYYSKSAKKTYNRVPGTHSDAQLARYKYTDERGPYRAENLTAPDFSPNRSFMWRGVNPGRDRHWALPLEDLERLYAKGRILSRRDGLPRKDGLKVYLSEVEPPALQDIWTDIVLAPTTAERLGYPTQKPERLLERILAVSSNPGDVVLDPFCGCGTTIAVAERLERRWIGIDISPTAVRIMRRRLNRQGAYDFDVWGLPETEDDLKKLKPFEFQNWVIDAIHGIHAPRKVGDMGIDGYSFLERLPIQVKQSEKVGRNVVDNFETAVRREKKHKGWIIAFSFTRGAIEEAARAKADGLEIGLTRVATLLDNPAEQALRPGLRVLDEELLTLARKAMQRGAPNIARPQRSAQELVTSARAEA
jgi:DNA modification methylase